MRRSFVALIDRARSSSWLLFAIAVTACAGSIAPSESWSNVTGGDNWRLLAVRQGSGDEAYRVEAATSESELTEMWRSLDLADDEVALDPTEEIAVTFGHGHGSSCPEIRLDGVAIDGAEIYSEVSDPITDEYGSARSCTADLTGAVIFVVAIERAALPDDRFTLRLTEDAEPRQDGLRPVLEVDLR